MKSRKPVRRWTTLQHILSVGTALLLTLTSGCNSVPIKDEAITFIRPDFTGLQVHTLFDIPVLSISQPDLMKMLPGMYLLSAQSLADFKGELEQLCSFNPCTYEQQQKVKAAIQRIDFILSVRLL